MEIEVFLTSFTSGAAKGGGRYASVNLHKAGGICGAVIVQNSIKGQGKEKGDSK
jgi:hypothetical protein